MLGMTQSLKEFLMRFHPSYLPLIAFGHWEHYAEIENEYLNWLLTDEGKSYCKGGSNYKEEKL